MKSQRSPLFRIWEGLQYAVLGASALSVILPIVLVLYFLLSKGLPGFTLGFLTDVPKNHMTEGGIMPVIVGTLLLLLGTFIFALPLGLFGAVYITEYGRRSKFTRVMRLAIVNLAGVPSIVYGLFGLGFFILVLGSGIDKIFYSSTLPKPTYGTGGIMWASLTMALLILPVVITASEEALLSVPDSFRQASLALGCTRWQTIRQVVLPNAMPGILTGMILGLSRAAGETAPILLTGAAFSNSDLPSAPFMQFMALPYHLYTMATQSADAPERIPWGTALVLLGVALGLNGVASIFRARARAGRKW